MVGPASAQHYRGVPTWVKVALIVLLVGVVALPGVLDWVINGSAGYPIAGACSVS